MTTKELHRGGLIDHLHRVVKELDASKKFYRAILTALNISIGGEGPEHFWADELFISS